LPLTGNYVPHCLYFPIKHYLLDKIKDFFESAYFFRVMSVEKETDLRVDVPNVHYLCAHSLEFYFFGQINQVVKTAIRFPKIIMRILSLNSGYG
jgi:hypothetical protein